LFEISVVLNDSERSNMLRLLGYKLANIFARFVMGVLGDEFGERDKLGELGPGEETGEKSITAFVGSEGLRR
jgi:hypothetical protein